MVLIGEEASATNKEKQFFVYLIFIKVETRKSIIEISGKSPKK